MLTLRDESIIQLNCRTHFKYLNIAQHANTRVNTYVPITIYVPVILNAIVSIDKRNNETLHQVNFKKQLTGKQVQFVK